MRRHRWLVVGAGVLVAAVLVAAFTFGYSWQSATIPDVTQPADLVLSARPWDGWPNSSPGCRFE